MGRSRRFQRPQAQHSPDPVVVPPGTEFAYEVAREELGRAIERVSRADTKAGILVGVLIAAAGGFLAIHLSIVARVLIAVPLVVSIGLTATCLLITRVQDAPSPRGVAQVVDLVPDQIKAALVPLLVEAQETTASQAAKKERLLRLAFAVTLVGIVVVLVAKAVRG